MDERKKLIITYVIVMAIIITFGVISVIICLNKEENKTKVLDLQTLDVLLKEEGLFQDNRMKDITASNIEEIFGIKKEEVKNVIGKMPLLDIYSGMYVVMEVEDTNMPNVEQKLIEFGNNYEKKWSTYMEDQYELVKARKINKKGNYIYMFISENATSMEEIIK